MQGSNLIFSTYNVLKETRVSKCVFLSKIFLNPHDAVRKKNSHLKMPATVSTRRLDKVDQLPSISVWWQTFVSPEEVHTQEHQFVLYPAFPGPHVHTHMHRHTHTQIHAHLHIPLNTLIDSHHLAGQTGLRETSERLRESVGLWATE